MTLAKSLMRFASGESLRKRRILKEPRQTARRPEVAVRAASNETGGERSIEVIAIRNRRAGKSRAECQSALLADQVVDEKGS